MKNNTHTHTHTLHHLNSPYLTFTVLDDYETTYTCTMSIGNAETKLTGNKQRTIN